MLRSTKPAERLGIDQQNQFWCTSARASDLNLSILRLERSQSLDQPIWWHLVPGVDDELVKDFDTLP